MKHFKAMLFFVLATCSFVAAEPPPMDDPIATEVSQVPPMTEEPKGEAQKPAEEQESDFVALDDIPEDEDIGD